MPDLVGIHHVQLAMPPGREDEARSFYSGVLGLAEAEKPPALRDRGGCWFRSVVGSVELHLGVEAGFRPARKAHPALLVEGLDEIRARLTSAGVATRDDVRLGGRRRFHAADPFGNRVEFVEHRADPAAN